MYAVFKAGGHQYRAAQGDRLEVDFIEGSEGDKVTFDKVMMLGGAKLDFGAPFLSGAKVEAVIKSQIRSEKVYAFRYRRRKNSKRMTGHRQPLTTIEISRISGT
jgi:large subunit ribosomal protein L21